MPTSLLTDVTSRVGPSAPRSWLGALGATRAVVPTLAIFFSSATIVGLADSARANVCGGALASWWCCDDAGYNWPQNFAWQDSCEDAGGNVNCSQCSAQPNNPLQLFKCCDSDGRPIPGTYSRGECVSAGFSIFEQTLICPNSQLFNCCDPVTGESAPGNNFYASECIAQGYEVVNISPADLLDGSWYEGCPAGGSIFGELISGAKDEVKDFINNFTDCAPSTAATYEPIIAGWLGGTFTPPLAQPVDKYTHCITSCIISHQCGRAAAAAVGWAREMLQMCDGTAGNSWGWGDECANYHGRVFGHGLPSSADFEDECLTYCTDTIDVDAVCGQGLLGNSPEFVQDVAEYGTALFQGMFDAFGSFLGVDSAWDNLAQKCEECIDVGTASGCWEIFFGLTIDDPGALVRSIRDIRAQGLAMIAAAGPLADGDRRITAGGAILQKEQDDVMVLVNNSLAEVDTYLTFRDDQLASVRVRGANGGSLFMSSAKPVQTTCQNPPCETRVPWVQWVVSRGITLPITVTP